MTIHVVKIPPTTWSGGGAKRSPLSWKPFLYFFNNISSVYPQKHSLQISTATCMKITQMNASNAETLVIFKNLSFLQIYLNSMASFSVCIMCMHIILTCKKKMDI